MSTQTIVHQRPLFDPPIVRRALRDSVVRLGPRHMIRNPVMFVVEVGSVFTTILGFHALATGQGEAPAGFILAVAAWLWLTVLFANFAEAMAEGRGKAQADALRRARRDVVAKRLRGSRRGVASEKVASTELRKGDHVLVEAGETIPADGDVVEGIASVNEAAVTGESAPVIRESGGDLSAVTGGTVVLSDWIVVRVSANPGETFLDRMIALVEGARRQKTPDLLEAFTRQGALALERALLVDEREAAALRARSEELRSTLLSTVSHDLRTPLAAITGAASALREDVAEADAAQRRELLETIVEESARLEKLLANLLEMTRLESTGVEIKREWVPIEEIVGAALERLSPQLTGREVRTELPPELPLVAADPMLLEQLVLNLVENAAKYTPAGSPIEIRARAEGGSLALEVADRGPGFAPGDELRAFEKFYRGAHPGISGAGLGLAIARAIAQLHGGSLVAENRAGGGALLRLLLPLDAGAPDHWAPESSTASRAA